MAQLPVASGAEWKMLQVHAAELNLSVTLLCGQSFRWREVGKDTWAGVIENSMVTLKQDEHDHIKFKFHPAGDHAKHEAILRDYFQLSHSLATLYPIWAGPKHSINELFKKSASRLTGVRILRQPPLECLFSFICSSNNNIKRITKMVDSLCATYGTFLGEVGEHKFYTFPTLAQLSGVDEETLRELGFGYRAKYIVQTTQQLRGYDKNWLENLRKSSRAEAQKNLITLMGVGRKVADCVSLFCLDKLDVVPVDTHIFTMAQKHMPTLKGKSLNSTIYDEINSFFRERFGELAGWAHTVLFAGDLAQFQLAVTPEKGEKKGRKNKESDKKDKEEEEDAVTPEKGEKKGRKNKEKESKKKEKREEENKENSVNESVPQKRKGGGKEGSAKKKKTKRAY